MANKVSLVTGGAGFIGRHLVRQLIARGEHVRILDIDPGPAPHDDGVEVVVGSILDAPLLRRAMRGARRVYHLAADPNLWARDKGSFHRINYEGTLAVLAAARDSQVERIVHTSTESILKGTVRTDGPIGEDDASPRLSDMPGPYCRSKYLAEEAALAAAKELPVIVVNPTLPVGSGDWKMTPPTRMIRGFLMGRFPAYLEFQLNLVPVEDAARGHILAAERGRVGQRYILGGRNLLLSEVLAMLQRLSGRPMPKRTVPYWLALLTGAVGEFVADYVFRLPPAAPLAGVRLARSPAIFRSTKARSELGFEAGSVEASLARAVAWLDEAGLLGRAKGQRAFAGPVSDAAAKR